MNEFEKVIKAHLDQRAASDPAFAAKYTPEAEDKKRNITACCNYIIAEVKKTGRQGFADDEVFGMAVHFYDESIEGPATAPSCKVVVNHEIELTQAEKDKLKEQARKEAEEAVLREEREKIRKEQEAAKKKAEAQAKKEEVLHRDRRRIEILRKRDEANRAKALKDDKNVLNVEYRRRLGKMLNVVLTVGDLTIRPLQNVLDFYEEGTAMHHCVYSNHYYDHAHTVIFTVRRGDTRVSTLEWNTATRTIIQNRAKYNGVPECDQEVRVAVLASKEILKLSRAI